MAARTLVPIVTAGLLFAAVGTGCSDAGSASAGAEQQAEATGAPALAKEQAQQVLAAYTGAVNRAGSRLDGRALQGIETDPQLSMDIASLKLRRAVKMRPPRLTFADPKFYIPRLSGFPRWFAVDTVTGRGDRALRHALLFTQAREGAPWLLTADPYPSDTALGRVALDSAGYATALRPDVQGDLPVAPAKLPAAHAALLTQGPGAPGAAVLADGPRTSETYKALKEGERTLAKRGVTLSSRFSPAPYTVYALRTKDHGAVVWYVLRQNEAYTSSRQGKLAVSGDLVGLAPAQGARTRMDTTVLVQYLATIPPKGRATISGMYRKAVNARTS